MTTAIFCDVPTCENEAAYTVEILSIEDEPETFDACSAGHISIYLNQVKR